MGSGPWPDQMVIMGTGKLEHKMMVIWDMLRKKSMTLVKDGKKTI